VKENLVVVELRGIEHPRKWSWSDRGGKSPVEQKQTPDNEKEEISWSDPGWKTLTHN